MPSEGGLARRLAALGGEPRKSLRQIVSKDIDSIRAARARRVDWKVIANAIEEEHGIEVNVDTLKVYASQFWTTRPINKSPQPAKSAAFQTSPAASDKPASASQARPTSDRPSAERQIRRPNIDPDEFE